MAYITGLLPGNSTLVYLFIFLDKLVEVALASLRSLLIQKGQRLPGAIIALFEYTFWLTITATTLNGFAEDQFKIIVLVSDYAIAHVCGSLIEEKIGFGSAQSHVFSQTKRKLIKRWKSYAKMVLH